MNTIMLISPNLNGDQRSPMIMILNSPEWESRQYIEEMGTSPCRINGIVGLPLLRHRTQRFQSARLNDIIPQICEVENKQTNVIFSFIWIQFSYRVNGENIQNAKVTSILVIQVQKNFNSNQMQKCACCLTFMIDLITIHHCAPFTHYTHQILCYS